MSDSTRLALIEGKVTGMAEHLDLLAAVVQDVEAKAATSARGRLEARLGVAVEAAPEGGDRTQRVGSAGLRMPNAPTGERAIANTTGNVVPMAGQANLLHEPSFEGVNTVAVTLTAALQTVGYAPEDYPAGTNAGIAWEARKTAGTVATCTLRQGAPRGAQDTNPFNSARVDLRIVPTGAGTHEIQFDGVRSPAAGHSVALLPELPFLIGAIRVATPTAQTLTNITSRSLVVELFDATDAVVRGTTTVNLPDTVDDTIVESARIWCSINLTTITGAQRDHPYILRTRLIVVSSGAGGDVNYSLGEPQLHLALSPDPSIYAPLLAGWTASALMRTNAAAATDLFVSSKLFADTVLRFAITADGAMEWGSGSATRDSRLDRSGAKAVYVDDGAGGPVTTTLTGALNLPTTIAPAQLTASQNDWNPTGLSTASYIQVKSNGAINITGIAAQPAGRLIVLMNVDTNNITLTNNDGASAAGNRFIMRGSRVLVQWDQVILFYSAGIWNVIG